MVNIGYSCPISRLMLSGNKSDLWKQIFLSGSSRIKKIKAILLSGTFSI
jgi:hypothetical protein